MDRKSGRGEGGLGGLPCGPGGGPTVPTGYSGRWGWWRDDGSTPSPCPTCSRSQEPHLAGPPLAPRSGGHWEAPAGDKPRERSGTHPRSLPRTPASSHTPTAAPAPTHERRPSGTCWQPSPWPRSPSCHLPTWAWQCVLRLLISGCLCPTTCSLSLSPL